MIRLTEPDLTGNEARYLLECIETTYVSSVGAFVQRLEALVSAATGAAETVATSSGTAGLHVALSAIGIGPGNLVVLPSYTFIASANAIAHCGATPWLFDISRESWTLNPDLLERTLAAETQRDGEKLIHKKTGQRVAAIMPVYALGTPADMGRIVAIARNFGLKVIADAAAALGARCQGQPIGKTGADLSVVSLNGNKTVTAGGGGAVIGDDPELVGLVRHLSTTARIGSDYSHDRVGYNYRMTNLQAAVGCAQMERLERLVDAKRRLRRVYDNAFAQLSGVSLFPSPAWAESACWISGIVVGPPAPPPETVRQRLRNAGIEARSFWKPMHRQLPYRNAPATAQLVADEIWLNVIPLPSSSHLSAIDQAKVIAAVSEAVRP